LPSTPHLPSRREEAEEREEEEEEEEGMKKENREKRRFDGLGDGLGLGRGIVGVGGGVLAEINAHCTARRAKMAA
jgi:hypothetical protein